MEISLKSFRVTHASFEESGFKAISGQGTLGSAKRAPVDFKWRDRPLTEAGHRDLPVRAWLASLTE